MLYAGTNRGLWVTLDGGAHWQSLRLNMPASAVYDIEIQSAQNDLVVGTHGRGAWIFDDLTPLQQWSSAAASEITLFPLRDAYRMWQWSPVNTFTDPKIPANEYVGDNAPYGALATYYFAREPKTATITIFDSAGRAVRHLIDDDVPKRAGLNRAAWDLSEDGPVKWSGTFKENQGPDTGAEALPGVYTVSLTADGTTKTQTVTVKADPRASADGYQARYEFLTGLYADLSAIDTMLNGLDSRLKSASLARAASLKAFRLHLTYDPRNIEDLNGPAQIREKFLDLISRMSTSFQAPTAAQREQAAIYKAELDTLASEYRQL